jgi:hypothetical protein
MKKFFLMTMAMIASVVASSAATVVVDCTNVANSGNGGVGSEVVNCPAFNSLPSNTQITSVGIFVLSTFNGNGTASQSGGQLQININYNPSIGAPDSATCNLDSTLVTFSLFCGSEVAPIFTAAGSGTNTYGAFTVAVDFTKGIDAGGIYGGAATGAVAVVYTYDTIPTNGEVPEPTTVALIGAGLVGVAAAARRRRS